MQSEKEIIIGDTRISYILNAEDTNSKITVFLHGWGAEKYIFKNFFEREEDFVAFDFPGFGKSSNLNHVWNLSDFADFLDSFLEKCCKNKNISFVAHSFGGRVLVKLLSKKEYLNIEKIILIGVPFKRKFGMREKLLEKVTKVGKFFSNVVPFLKHERMRKLWYSTISADDYQNLSGEIMRSTFKNIISEPIENLADSFSNYKTFFIWGKKDFSAPAKDAKEVAKRVGANFFDIKDGDHFPFLRNTKEGFFEIYKKIKSDEI